jgi:hypothetical protein
MGVVVLTSSPDETEERNDWRWEEGLAPGRRVW